MSGCALLVGGSWRSCRAAPWARSMVSYSHIPWAQPGSRSCCCCYAGPTLETIFPGGFTSSHQPWEGGQLLSHLHAEKCQVRSLPSRQCDSLSRWCSREVGRSIKNACTVRHRARLCYPRRKHYGHKTQPIMRSETIKKTVSGLWLP